MTEGGGHGVKHFPLKLMHQLQTQCEGEDAGGGGVELQRESDQLIG